MPLCPVVGVPCYGVRSLITRKKLPCINRFTDRCVLRPFLDHFLPDNAFFTTFLISSKKDNFCFKL